MKDKNKELNDKIAEAQLGGGKARVESQHKKGKLTARERIGLLMDEGSFEEIGMFVTHRGKWIWDGAGKIFGRWCYNRIRNYKWKISICFRPGFYRFWWISIGNPC